MTSWSGSSFIKQDWVHSKVHAGAFFQSHFYSTGVVSAASINYVITTGGTYSNHSGFEIATSGECQVFFHEAPSFTSGTTLTAYNKRRESTRATESVIVANATITNNGTELDHELIPAGNGSKFSAGAYAGVDPRGAEWILAKNRSYLLRIVNTSGSTIDVSLAHGYYENG